MVVLGGESGSLAPPPARVGHSRVRAAAPRGGEVLALDHVYPQLGGGRLVAQREVHGAAHLHTRLHLPRQAHQAAAQLGVDRGSWGGGGQSEAQAPIGAVERGGFRWRLWGQSEVTEVKGIGR